MTRPRPQFAISVHPGVWTDLQRAPRRVEDLAHRAMQELAAGDLRGAELTGDLDGMRKLLISRREQYRLVYAERPAVAPSVYDTEIQVMAVGPRADHEVYDTVAARLGLDYRPVSAATRAARARSPQLGRAPLRLVPTPAASRSDTPVVAPVLPLTRKGPQR